MNHSSAICDQSLPRILVIRDSNVVQLDVDSEVNHVVGPLNPTPVDHREPVFVGGVPGKNCLKRTSSKSEKHYYYSTEN